MALGGMKAAWLALAFVWAFAPAAMAQAAAVEGVWKTELKSEVTIRPCSGGYCGYLTKVVVPPHIRAQEGEAIAGLSVEDYVDDRNKDPKLRTRKILGLQILTLRPSKDGVVFNGKIYNPEDGNTYSGYVEIQSAKALRLNGCVLFNIICRGENWVRVK